MIKESPILITGIPRSGASMIAATINLCGAFAGNMSKRNMYSNDQIKKLVELELKAISIGYNDFPVNFKDFVEDIIIHEGYKEGSWMYKDSNLNKMWRVWYHFYPEAKWVIVRRRTGDIVESCMKTAYMTEHSDREGWLTMVHQYEKRFVEMISEGVNCKVIWPERMVNGDYKQIIELCDWLGLKWDNKALSYIDTLLWGNKLRKEAQNGSKD